MEIQQLLENREGAGIVSAHPDDSITEVAVRMREGAVGCLVVLDRKGAINGILSERDILFRMVAAGGDPVKTTVRDVMTAPVQCCEADADLADVCRAMSQRGIRHMPVTEDGRPVGVVSLRDVMTTYVETERAASELAVFSMARLAESRDPETGAHLDRVVEFTTILARALAEDNAFSGRIDEDYIALLRQTSALHDIGKVAIPDYVLLKPDHLTEDEYTIMKSHAARGAETLEFALRRFPDARFLRMARDVAAHHHERFDGKGYPDGLAGQDIPLCARIFALVDVYDALVSKRVYKKAFPHELATNIILSEEGSQFDPAVVRTFRRCNDEFRVMGERYSGQGNVSGENPVDQPAFPTA